VLTPKRPENKHKRETLEDKGELRATQPIIPEKINRTEDHITEFKSLLRRINM
jgi:hypothetical protein